MKKSHLRSYLESTKTHRPTSSLNGVINAAIYVFYTKSGAFSWTAPIGGSMTEKRGNFLLTRECYIFGPAELTRYENAELAPNGNVIEINDFVYQMLIS